MEITQTRHASEPMRVLSDEELKARAPSIFATEPYKDVSSRYAFIPTSAILAAMRSEGFLPVQAMQSRALIPGKRDFTKHMIRMRHQNFMDKPMIVGDSVPEIVLVNSHDRSSAYELSVGMFRLACANGMMVKSRDFGSINVTHQGDIVHNVIEGSYRIIEDVPQIANRVEAFHGIRLNESQRGIFALAAMQLQYPDDANGNGTSPVEYQQLLQPRRFYDNGKDLWTTFNVVQENLVKGGLEGRAASGRRSTTRGVKSVTADVRINKALWMLTEKMAELMQ